MAGYGGQEIALDADTPSQLQQAAATADTARTQSQLAKATLAADIQYKQALASSAQSTAEQGALTLEQSKQLWGLRQARAAQLAAAPQADGSASPLATSSAQSGPTTPLSTPLLDHEVDAVIHGFDASDPQASAKADAKLAALAKSGNPMASQFIGKINDQSVNGKGGWMQQIGANAVRQASQPNATPGISQLAAVQPGQSFDEAMAPVGAPGTPYGGAQSQLAPMGGAAAPAARAAPSVLTGQVDPAMQKMAALFPKEYIEQVALEGQMKFLQTGDLSMLARTNQTEFKNLMEAYKAQTDAQHTQTQMRADMMGRAAFAVLDLGHTQHDNWLKAHPNDEKGANAAANSGAALEAYRTAIIDAANNKWITPDQARARLSQPIDWGFVSATSINGQTVSEAYKSLGLQKANEQEAEVNNPMPHYTANQVDANGHLITVNSTPRPGQSPLTVTGVDAGSKGMLTLQARQQMLVNGGMSEQEAALYAAGDKPMPFDKLKATADRLALTDFNAQTQAHLLDPKVPEPNLGDLQKQYAQQISSGGTPAAAPVATPPSQVHGAAAAAPSGTPNTLAGTPQALRPVSKGYTAGQSATSKQLIRGEGMPGMPKMRLDQTAPRGMPEHPWIPRTQAELDAIPYATPNSPSFFIGQDGLPRNKMKR